jgi:NAD(P)-dependent dehydrogenase (short-subunit alcohol dehydrogenase family)
MSDMRGQVAVVTDGGRGLGRAFALALAAAGCAVAVIARSH